jgi:hypothetical protein
MKALGGLISARRSLVLPVSHMHDIPGLTVSGRAVTLPSPGCCCQKFESEIGSRKCELEQPAPVLSRTELINDHPLRL